LSYSYAGGIDPQQESQSIRDNSAMTTLQDGGVSVDDDSRIRATAEVYHEADGLCCAALEFVLDRDCPASKRAGYKQVNIEIWGQHIVVCWSQDKWYRNRFEVKIDVLGGKLYAMVVMML
jgi:hypothetical protein